MLLRECGGVQSIPSITYWCWDRSVHDHGIRRLVSARSCPAVIAESGQGRSPRDATTSLVVMPARHLTMGLYKARQEHQLRTGCRKNGSAHGIRTRDLRLERAVRTLAAVRRLARFVPASGVVMRFVPARAPRLVTTWSPRDADLLLHVAPPGHPLCLLQGARLPEN